MKKTIAILTVCLAVFGLAACGAPTSKEEAVKVYAPDEELIGTLEVAIAYPAGYEQFISAFKVKHPGVDVKLTTFPDVGTAYTILGTKFMAGECYDVIDIQGLPLRNYADKGYLTDLSAYMEADANYNKAAYNTYVFEAMQHNGALYAMPSGYRYDFISINKNAPAALIEEFSKLDGISLTQMIDMYNRSGMQEELTLYKSPSMIYELSKSMDSYIDYTNKTCNFNTPEFIDKIKTYRDVFGAEDLGLQPNETSMDANGVARYNDGALATMYLFNDSMLTRDFYLHLGYDELSFGPTKPLVNDDGALQARVYEAHAITSFCEDKALAWEYLKFVSSTEPQVARGLYGAPTNRAALEAIFMDELTHVVNVYKENGGPYPSVAEDEFIANALALFTNTSNLPVRVQLDLGLEESSLTRIFRSELELFVTGSSTAEQAAENIQKRISLALSE